MSGRAIRYHLIVCRGPECGDARNSARLHAELERLVKERGLTDQVEIGRQSCFGKCMSGPNMLVREASATLGGSSLGGLMPGASGDAVLYAGLRMNDLPRILEEHIVHGRPVRAMLSRSTPPRSQIVPKHVARKDS